MIRRLLDLPNDDPRKIVFVAVALCLICSLVVSSAAVLLGPLQDAEIALDRKQNVLLAAGLVTDEEVDDIDALFQGIDTRIVDLTTGRFTDAIDAASFDSREAARDPLLSVALADELDVAGIGRRELYAPVYLVRAGDELERIVLPIYGQGLWSTMYGYLAIEADLNTVASIRFYEHAETPGLGDKIEDDDWRATWAGKLIYDDAGIAQLGLIKGVVNPASPEAVHQIDGLAGATLTGNGVTNMIRFWLGPDGYGPFLAWLRTEGV